MISAQYALEIVRFILLLDICILFQNFFQDLFVIFLHWPTFSLL